MGVTIHFDGLLSSPSALNSVVKAAQSFATEHSWPSQLISEKNASLARVRDDQDWDYVGPTSGIVLHPHKDSEPVRLEFDRDLYIQEFTKTQFAGTGVHIQVIQLLRLLAPHFASLSVEDEGEFWDTSDLSVLEGHFQAFFRALGSELSKRPGARVKVRLPSGRIVDFLT